MKMYSSQRNRHLCEGPNVSEPGRRSDQCETDSDSEEPCDGHKQKRKHKQKSSKQGTVILKYSK